MYVMNGVEVLGAHTRKVETCKELNIKLTHLSCVT